MFYVNFLVDIQRGRGYVFGNIRLKKRIEGFKDRRSGIVLTTLERDHEERKEVIHLACNNFSISFDGLHIVGLTPIGEDVKVALSHIEDIEEVPRF